MKYKFSVGEVAIFWRPGHRSHGKEITIASHLQTEEVWSEGEIKLLCGHRVELGPEWDVAPENRGRVFFIKRDDLRKRRPDVGSWDDVSKLTKWKPAEVTT